MISMYGVRSELFVAMNSRGRLYGTVGVRNCISLLLGMLFLTEMEENAMCLR